MKVKNDMPIGNFTVGGAGKTPTTLALVQALREAGWHPGIVSRGYARDGDAPIDVEPDTDAQCCGDEPLLIWRRTRVPLMGVGSLGISIPSIDRCIVPASGFFEWQGEPGHKQPFAITLPGERLFTAVAQALTLVDSTLDDGVGDVLTLDGSDEEFGDREAETILKCFKDKKAR